MLKERLITVGGAAVGLAVLILFFYAYSSTHAEPEIGAVFDGTAVTILVQCADEGTSSVYVAVSDLDGRRIWEASTASGDDAIIDRFVVGEAPRGFVETIELDPANEEEGGLFAVAERSDGWVLFTTFDVDRMDLGRVYVEGRRQKESPSEFLAKCR
ncbi:MAG: hypothetical protein AB7L84_08000 [Acidimicrobiia bacterium]